MHVRRLSLTDFRSYEQVDLELTPGVSVLCGPNGQGKTNLVEAVGYLATLGSHRVATDAPLVRLGAERALVRLEVVRGDRAALIELEIVPGRANRARVNRAPVPRAREVLGLLRSVLFAPEDLALVKGDPAERRRFLDDLLVQQAPRLAGVRADYDRVLRQRNALLKSSATARRGSEAEVIRTLEAWDQHLARLGAELLAARLTLVDALRPRALAGYAALAAGGGSPGPGPGGRPGPGEPAAQDPGKDLGMDYSSAMAPTQVLTPDQDLLQAQLLDAIARRRREELDRGVTLVGPHRDDLVLRLGAAPVRGYASHGESWSAALALRLASYDLLRDLGGPDADPVLILDDVFAELDDLRRARLVAAIPAQAQVLVTVAVPDDVPAGLSGARYHVEAGQVRREH